MAYLKFYETEQIKDEWNFDGAVRMQLRITTKRKLLGGGGGCHETPLKSVL